VVRLVVAAWWMRKRYAAPTTHQPIAPQRSVKDKQKAGLAAQQQAAVKAAAAKAAAAAAEDGKGKDDDDEAGVEEYERRPRAREQVSFLLSGCRDRAFFHPLLFQASVAKRRAAAHLPAQSRFQSLPPIHPPTI